VIFEDMVEIWVPVVFGAGGVVLGLTNYLGKVRAERELEALKSELQIHAAERQMRVSNLYERRAERIADLYGRMAELSPMCERYVSQLERDNRQENLSEMTGKLSDFCIFFDTSQIYFPERLCILLEKTVIALKTSLSGNSVDGAGDHADGVTQKEKMAAFVAAVTAFEATIPLAQKALKDEFRKMFGSSYKQQLKQRGFADSPCVKWLCGKQLSPERCSAEQLTFVTALFTVAAR
jgi:hypothetical protein